LAQRNPYWRLENQLWSPEGLEARLTNVAVLCSNFRGNFEGRAASIFSTASLTFEADFWRVLLFDTPKSRVIRSRLKWLLFFSHRMRNFSTFRMFY
jgi:hypothetical protein